MLGLFGHPFAYYLFVKQLRLGRSLRRTDEITFISPRLFYLANLIPHWKDQLVDTPTRGLLSSSASRLGSHRRSRPLISLSFKRTVYRVPTSVHRGTHHRTRLLYLVWGKVIGDHQLLRLSLTRTYNRQAFKPSSVVKFLPQTHLLLTTGDGSPRTLLHSEIPNRFTPELLSHCESLS